MEANIDVFDLHSEQNKNKEEEGDAENNCNRSEGHLSSLFKCNFNNN